MFIEFNKLQTANALINGLFRCAVFNKIRSDSIFVFCNWSLSNSIRYFGPILYNEFLFGIVITAVTVLILSAPAGIILHSSFLAALFSFICVMFVEVNKIQNCSLGGVIHCLVCFVYRSY